MLIKHSFAVTWRTSAQWTVFVTFWLLLRNTSICDPMGLKYEPAVSRGVKAHLFTSYIFTSSFPAELSTAALMDWIARMVFHLTEINMALMVSWQFTQSKILLYSSQQQQQQKVYLCLKKLMLLKRRAAGVWVDCISTVRISKTSSQPGQKERVQWCVYLISFFIQHMTLKNIGRSIVVPLQGLKQHEGNIFTKNLKLTHSTDSQFQESQHFGFFFPFYPG